MYKSLQKRMAGEKSAVKKLKAITDYYRNYYQVMEALGGCPILNVVNDSKNINDALYADAVAAANTMTATLAEVIDLGIKQKKFRKKTNSKELATLIYSMIQGAIFLSYIEQNEMPLVIATNQIDEIIASIRK